MRYHRRLALELTVFLALGAGLAFLFDYKTLRIDILSVKSAVQSKVKCHVVYKDDSKELEESYVLVPTSGTAEVLLLDTDGNLINLWNIDADRARLVKGGHLLVVYGSKWGRGKKRWKSRRPYVAEYDWDGNLVWEYRAPDVVHHDTNVLDNRDVVFLYRVFVPESIQKQRLGWLARLPIRTDGIRIVSREGRVIWDWKFYEHFELNECGRLSCKELWRLLGENRNYFDWTHINTVSVIPPNKWYDGGDVRFKPGNLLIQVRNWWKTMIIDWQSARVVWTYTGKYNGGVGGGHDPYMIPKGLDGAGNILLFDNGSIVHSDESYVLEINPSDNSLVWVLDMGKNLFSRAGGSAQRLRNGNTLVSEDISGRVIEVTKDKHIVWGLECNKRVNRVKKYYKDEIF